MANLILRGPPAAPVKHARYGPRDRYEAPPGGGFCLSVFVLLRQRGKVLVGVPAEHPRWVEDWIPQFAVYPREEYAHVWSTPRLPSAYLREGESPEKAAQRILRGQLRARGVTLGKPEVSSWVAPSDWYGGQPHWDLTFTFPAKATLPAKPGPWWSRLEWRDPRTLRAADFGWNADLVRALGVGKA